MFSACAHYLLEIEIKIIISRLINTLITSHELSCIMACCAVAAYIVYRYLKLHQWVVSPFSMKRQPAITYNEHESWGWDEHPQASTPENQTQECVLTLGGLTCGSCVSELHGIIKDIPGVVKASVSLSLLRAHIAFTAVTSLEAIVDAIQAAGYEASPSPIIDSNAWGKVMPVIRESGIDRDRGTQTWRRGFFLSALCSSTVVSAKYLLRFKALNESGSIDLIIKVAVALSLVAGSKIHLETARSIWYRRKPNMSTLGSLGIFIALVQAIFINAGRKEYWLRQSELEVIPMLSTTLLSGRLLKAIVSKGSFDFGTPLINLIPSTASILLSSDEGCTVEVPTELITPGDRLLTREGDRLPCDGMLESDNKGFVLETWINGSTIPRVVKRGDNVLAGSRVEKGPLVLKALSCGRSTELGKVLEAVIDAEMRPENVDEDLTPQFVTAAIIATAIFCILLLLLVHDISFASAMQRTSSMLLAACPCTFSLSNPAAKLLATG